MADVLISFSLLFYILIITPLDTEAGTLVSTYIL